LYFFKREPGWEFTKLLKEICQIFCPPRHLHAFFRQNQSFKPFCHLCRTLFSHYSNYVPSFVTLCCLICRTMVHSFLTLCSPLLYFIHTFVELWSTLFKLCFRLCRTWVQSFQTLFSPLSHFVLAFVELCSHLCRTWVQPISNFIQFNFMSFRKKLR